MADETLNDDIDPRKKKRCYHRVISGLQRQGLVRFVTLTSSDTAPADIQHSFRKLMWRLRRRGLVRDYIKVIEVKQDGREHIHMAYRGKYIDQKWLSELWMLLHNSSVVDIRQLKSGQRDKKRAANYLAKYMAKEMCRRYSWSKFWVYPGFIRVWCVAKRIRMSALSLFKVTTPTPALLNAWKYHLFQGTKPAEFLISLHGVFSRIPAGFEHVRFPNLMFFFNQIEDLIWT